MDACSCFFTPSSARALLSGYDTLFYISCMCISTSAPVSHTRFAAAPQVVVSFVLLSGHDALSVAAPKEFA